MQLETVAALWQGQEGAADKLSFLLSMKPPKDEEPEARAARRKTAARISALVIANAFIFQEQLAASDGQVGNLSWLDDQADVITAARERWRWIYVNVNYRPIFELGERALGELPHTRNTMIAVRNLLREARAICGNQAALRHDLMGRIYHWLLYHAKYLGTYYTKTSAATLLLGLAMSRSWKIDFGDPRALADFKVADLACGTGTLLMATAQALSDAYIRERAADARSLTPVDLRTLHQALMQNVLHGYDVLPSAVHLTASTLALLAPEVAFNHMNLWVMPMGLIAGNPRLGSLDFLAAKSGEVQVQITLDLSQSEREDASAETVRTGAGSRRIAVARIPDLDLCVMNPPFVRSVGGNLLFGSLPDDERAALQKELKKQVKSVDAEITAGLGSVFVALADQHVKPGGRLAFVLPAALASGEAWAATRRLIGERYELEFVVASHDAEGPNFSENTDLSELLFVARRLAHDEKAERTTYVNLWRNPQSIHEALDLVSRVAAAGAPALIEDAGFTTIRGEGRKLGDVVSLPVARGEANWMGALFAQTELLRTADLLLQGELRIEGAAPKALRLCRIADLGGLGYDRRDIHDAFTVSRDDQSIYDAFWNHDAESVRTLAQVANAKLVPRTEAARGRKLKNAAPVWGKAGRIMLAERIRSNTQRVLAVGLPEIAVGNTWWSFSTDQGVEACKGLLLWLNSSLGVLAYFANRVITEGAFMQMKKPAWASMPVLDVRKLDEVQLKSLSTAYDELSTEPLMALAKLNIDPVRRRIDEAIGYALDLPDLKPLRDLLAREPGLTGQPISPAVSQAGLELVGGETGGTQAHRLI